MPRSRLEQIRDKIRARKYDLTIHAVEETAEDDLDLLDMENAVLTGRIHRIDRDDSRGTRYVVEGYAVDGVTPVGVVGRHSSNGRFRIITVYRVTPLGE